MLYPPAAFQYSYRVEIEESAGVWHTFGHWMTLRYACHLIQKLAPQYRPVPTPPVWGPTVRIMRSDGVVWKQMPMSYYKSWCEFEVSEGASASVQGAGSGYARVGASLTQMFRGVLEALGLAPKVSTDAYRVPTYQPTSTPGPGTGSPKYRWGVRARLLYGGVPYWIDVRYPASPSAALTKVELCEYLAGMPNKVITVFPNSADAYSVTLTDNPYLQVTAYTESMSTALSQTEMNLQAMLGTFGCGDASVGLDPGRVYLPPGTRPAPASAYRPDASPWQHQSPSPQNLSQVKYRWDVSVASQRDAGGLKWYTIQANTVATKDQICAWLPTVGVNVPIPGDNNQFLPLTSNPPVKVVRHTLLGAPSAEYSGNLSDVLNQIGCGDANVGALSTVPAQSLQAHYTWKLWARDKGNNWIMLTQNKVWTKAQYCAYLSTLPGQVLSDGMVLSSKSRLFCEQRAMSGEILLQFGGELLLVQQKVGC